MPSFYEKNYEKSSCDQSNRLFFLVMVTFHSNLIANGIVTVGHANTISIKLML